MTQEQLEIIAKAYEILAQDDETAKLTIGAPIPKPTK